MYVIGCTEISLFLACVTNKQSADDSMSLWFAAGVQMSFLARRFVSAVKPFAVTACPVFAVRANSFATKARPFRVLGLQQVAIGALVCIVFVCSFSVFCFSVF